MPGIPGKRVVNNANPLNEVISQIRDEPSLDKIQGLKTTTTTTTMKARGSVKL